MISRSQLINVTPFLWEIPASFRNDMRVPARIYAHERMLPAITSDNSLEQLVNVATLPGIVRFALAMPDIHEGYGFPVGGVAAFSASAGIISPGGIGYDINCGVRLLLSQKTRDEITMKLSDLGRTIFANVPSGVGRGGNIVLSRHDLDRVLKGGAPHMVELGYGTSEDMPRIESEGVLADAAADFVSDEAKARGRNQLGTIGAGNHFVEVGVVETIFDADTARAMGLFTDQVTVLIHTGSRGLGHQIATDFIRVMIRAMKSYGITVPDRQLACAPFSSSDGQNYFRAMAAAANFAWANRQLITWEIRNAWQRVLGAQGGELRVLYDVAHNIAKIEEHLLDGKKQSLVVHRKGATRAFPGQPVIIPGSMGTASYVLVGQAAALEASFGSSCHGAGRIMSRMRARRGIGARELRARLSSMGIVVNASSARGLVEEAPEAYKDIDEVVNVIHSAGIAKKIARLKPLAVIKG